MRWLLCALFVVVLNSAHAFAAEPEPRTVRTTGTATMWAAPDEVELRFAVITQHLELADAKAENDKVSKSALELIRSLKVEERDIQTQAVWSSRDEDKPYGGPVVFKGYSVTRQYAVLLRDVSKFEALLDALLVKKECRIHHHEFRSSQSRRLRDDARKRAITAAREKAQLLARELNCTVGPPRTIQEEAYTYYFRNVQGNSNGHDEDASREQESTPLGQIELAATVGVTFDLIPERK